MALRYKYESLILMNITKLLSRPRQMILAVLARVAAVSMSLVNNEAPAAYDVLASVVI
jgi:hypothetical protein